MFAKGLQYPVQPIFSNLASTPYAMIHDAGGMPHTHVCIPCPTLICIIYVVCFLWHLFIFFTPIWYSIAPGVQGQCQFPPKGRKLLPLSISYDISLLRLYRKFHSSMYSPPSLLLLFPKAVLYYTYTPIKFHSLPCGLFPINASKRNRHFTPLDVFTKYQLSNEICPVA